MVGSPCYPRDSQESSPTPQFKSINSPALSLLHGPTLTFIRDWFCKSNTFTMAIFPTSFLEESQSINYSVTKIIFFFFFYEKQILSVWGGQTLSGKSRDLGNLRICCWILVSPHTGCGGQYYVVTKSYFLFLLWTCRKISLEPCE